MSGERIDYGIERQRHERFVGRAALLERLDELLVAEGADRWVVVTGGPGMGKSALLAAWLARREAAGAGVPHHFIRRGEYDWDDPAKLVGSLVAQIERLTGLQESDADARGHPAARLAAPLARVSARLAHGERMVVLIDGLDEYDPRVQVGDPLAAFLPHALPRGVSFLCASRPKHPYVELLEARDGELVRIDLDGPELAEDNEATVRAFWEEAAPSLGLDARFIDEAVARAGGNLQHAATLRKHLAGLPAAQRRVEDIPRGLAALLTKSWQRIAADPIATRGLGILCAAREALTLDELDAASGWSDERQAFLRGARELLVETRRPDGQFEYRLHHDTIRAHVASMLGPATLRAHHAALARRLATWPAPTSARLYSLRHALIHRAEAGEWADAWRLAADTSFLEAKCRELGAHEAEADVARAGERCRTADEVLGRRFDDLARALTRESHWLRAAPEATAALVWNRLRRSGWTADELEEQLRVPAGAPFLQIRHGAMRESPSLVRDLVGHSEAVRACVVTPDGRRVVSASVDRTLKIWDLDTGRALATLSGHRGPVFACAVTPDGRRVVSASDDKTLRIWELDTGRAVATLNGHSNWVFACAVTPDGRRVVSASTDKTLKIWDLDTGRALTTLIGHWGPVFGCAVTPDGRRAVSAALDGLKIWDLDSGRALATLVGHSHMVNACAVTPDGQRVVSASMDWTLKIWDLDTGDLRATLQAHSKDVNACTVTPDGRRVISASGDRTLKVWDLHTGRAVATLEGHGSPVLACAVTPDGRRLVSASTDGSLKLWNLGTEHALSSLAGHSDRVRTCTVTPGDRRLITTSDDRMLRVWDLETGDVVTALEVHSSVTRACTTTPDGRRVISTWDDRTLRVWDLDTGRAVTALEHGDLALACAVTPDGRRAVAAPRDGTLTVWDLDTGRVVTTLVGHAAPVLACTATPDSRRLVSASMDGTLKVWDLDTGRALATLEGHTDMVIACALTPDGRRLASASHDRTLKIWDLDTGQAVATLEGHSEPVTACAVPPDGRRLISASEDRTLRVWDLDTCTCLFTHRGDAAYTAVAAAATVVAAGDATGAVWVLSWPSSRRSHPVPAGPWPSKHIILFLAANPSGTDLRALDREARAIQVELERSGYRDCFELVTRWAAEPLDLLRELRRLKPTVVHFSGHGGEPGLYFQNSEGRPHPVSTGALAETFRAAGASVKVAVLSACYTEAQADALLAHVDCVVGMSGAIRDDAARSFAIGFYGGLGEREPVAAAYEQGRAAIRLENLPDGDRPQLKVRAGIDASQLVLAANPH